MIHKDFFPAPMNAAPNQEITDLLKAWESGQASALDNLIPLVYPELKRLAQRHMCGRERETLQTTALVHQAYIRLVDLSSVRWQDRAPVILGAPGRHTSVATCGLERPGPISTPCCG